MISHFLNSLLNPHAIAALNLPLSLGFKDIFSKLSGVTGFIIPIITFIATVLIDNTLINLLANTLTGSDSLTYTGGPGSSVSGGVPLLFQQFMDKMPGVFNALIAEAYMIAGLCLAIRIVKSLFSRREGFSNFSLFDSILRFGAFIVLLGPPGGAGNTSLVYKAMTFLIDFSNTTAQLLSHVILTALNTGGTVPLGTQPLADTLDHALELTGLIGAISIAINPKKTFMLIPLLIFSGLLLYVLFISLSRFLYIAIAIAFAPLCLAVAVYDFNNHFTKWWKDMFVGALLIPVIAVPILALTVGIAYTVTSGGSGIADPVGGTEKQIIGFAIICVGFWFTGHTVQSLATRNLHNHTVAGAAGGLLAGARLRSAYHGLNNAFSKSPQEQMAAAQGGGGGGGPQQPSPTSDMAGSTSALPAGMELEPTPFDGGEPIGRRLNAAVSRNEQAPTAFGGTVGGFRSSLEQTMATAGAQSYQAAAMSHALVGTSVESAPASEQISYVVDHAEDPAIMPLVDYYATSDEAKGSTGPVSIAMDSGDFQRVKTQISQARGDV